MIKKSLLLLLLSFAPLLALADEAVSKLEPILNSFQTLSAEFTQRITGGHGKAMQESKGNMIIHKPSEFRWETKQPNPQLIIANGDRLWVYDVDLEQVTVQPFKQTTGNSPARLLSGDLDIIKHDFNIQISTETKEGITFRLIPKQKDHYFQWIDVTFVKTKDYPDKVLSHMQMVDNIDQTTELHFRHVVKNPKVKAGLFNFVPPKGVDVIDMETQKKGHNG